MWFPANYVEEIDVANEVTEGSPLGNYRTMSVDLTGVSVGKYHCIFISLLLCGVKTDGRLARVPFIFCAVKFKLVPHQV
jgi:hypothetical protein